MASHAFVTVSHRASHIAETRRNAPLDESHKKGPELTTSQLSDTLLSVEDVVIKGFAGAIILRSYRPIVVGVKLPIVVYFHGGHFVEGSLDGANSVAQHIARKTVAWVVSVGYSLAPRHPFPAALEDGYRAIEWITEHAKARRANPAQIAVMGYDAGGNLATCVAAVCRDRTVHRLSAQVLIAPLLDPSLTRIATDVPVQQSDMTVRECTMGYRAYLSRPSDGLHPYAAPLESERLGDLAPAFVASAGADPLHVEAERYAQRLISFGVQTEFVRYPGIARDEIAAHPQLLADVIHFLKRKFRIEDVSS